MFDGKCFILFNKWLQKSSEIEQRTWKQHTAVNLDIAKQLWQVKQYRN